MTAKEILYTKFGEGFFSDFEEVFALEAMEQYKDNALQVLDGIIEIKENERKNWADMCIKKQARIEELENQLNKKHEK